jgi:hypothetical protein
MSQVGSEAHDAAARAVRREERLCRRYPAMHRSYGAVARRLKDPRASLS